LRIYLKGVINKIEKKIEKMEEKLDDKIRDFCKKEYSLLTNK
jgi:hypothetical protein